MTSLEGKIVLVTGASSGIGAATARALGECGASVVAHYGKNREGVVLATNAIPANRKRLVGVDLLEPDGARRLWKAAVLWRGRVDVLVNNAATMLECPLDAPDDEWDSVLSTSLQVNVTASANVMREAVLHFRSRGGILITLSSWNAQRGSGNPNLVAYSATKAAVKAMTQTVARNYAADGVLAYILAPGVVRTDMSIRSAESTGGEDAVTATLAMREWVPPEELAELISVLSTGRFRHLTGATIDVNGATYIR